MKEHYFCVAGQTFAVTLPDRADVGVLLPSFRPFRCEQPEDNGLLFRFHAGEDGGVRNEPVKEVLDDTVCDMGRVRLAAVSSGYRIDLRRSPSAPVHTMLAAGDFSSATACVDWHDPFAGDVVSSMLRMVYSQAVTRCSAVSVHASVVVLDGKAYMFMGKSGTGKSTHSSLWIKAFPGCELLNDDNPIVRIADGRVLVSGAPWSGKTPCYRNLEFPLAGVARLEQAPENRFLLCDGAGAFAALLPGCSVIRCDEFLYNSACDILAFVAGVVPVARLRCLPDVEAAELCKNEFEKNNL